MKNKIYLYCFDQYFWFDRICYFETDQKLTLGTLIKNNNYHYLILWKHISFQENYTQQIKLDWFEIIENSLLSKNVINLINYITYTYYTTYKNTIPLFLWNDINYLLKKQSIKLKSIKDNYKIIHKWFYWFELWEKSNWQTLIITPDIRTMRNLLLPNISQESTIFLHWQTSINQKSIAFWWIKKWIYKNIICTHSQIFFDRKKLDQIIIIDSHKWYYKNQQDPRYNTVQIIKKFQEIYKCDFVNKWYELNE